MKQQGKRGGGEGQGRSTMNTPTTVASQTGNNSVVTEEISLTCKKVEGTGNLGTPQQGLPDSTTTQKCLEGRAMDIARKIRVDTGARITPSEALRLARQDLGMVAPTGAPRAPRPKPRPSWDRGERSDTYKGYTTRDYQHRQQQAEEKVQQVKDKGREVEGLNIDKATTAHPPELDGTSTAEVLRLQQDLPLDTESGENDKETSPAVREITIHIFGWSRVVDEEMAGVLDRRAVRMGVILVKNDVVKGYAGERRITVAVRKKVADRRVAEELQGMLRQAFNDQKLRAWVTEEAAEWSDLVVQLRETRGTSAWDAANRICRHSKRKLVGRKPTWLYQENEDVIGKGVYGIGTLRFTVEGPHLDTMQDAPWYSYGKTIARQYKAYRWDTELKGFIDSEWYRVSGYVREYHGQTRGRQWEPYFPPDACKKCGQLGHGEVRCLARGTKEAPICRYCNSWHRDYECPQRARDKALVMEIQRRERNISGNYESIEEETHAHKHGYVERKWRGGRMRSPTPGPSRVHQQKKFCVAKRHLALQSNRHVVCFPYVANVVLALRAFPIPSHRESALQRTLSANLLCNAQCPRKFALQRTTSDPDLVGDILCMSTIIYEHKLSFYFPAIPSCLLRMPTTIYVQKHSFYFPSFLAANSPFRSTSDGLFHTAPLDWIT